jgi:hypothetical protein
MWRMSSEQLHVDATTRHEYQILVQLPTGSICDCLLCELYRNARTVAYSSQQAVRTPMITRCNEGNITNIRHCTQPATHLRFCRCPDSPAALPFVALIITIAIVEFGVMHVKQSLTMST